MLFLLLINLNICLLSSENHPLGKWEVDIFEHNFHLPPQNHTEGLSSEKEWAVFFNSLFRLVAHWGQKAGNSEREGREGRLRAGTLWTTVMHKSQRLCTFKTEE